MDEKPSAEKLAAEADEENKGDEGDTLRKSLEMIILENDELQKDIDKLIFDRNEIGYSHAAAVQDRI